MFNYRMKQILNDENIEESIDNIEDARQQYENDYYEEDCTDYNDDGDEFDDEDDIDNSTLCDMCDGEGGWYYDNDMDDREEFYWKDCDVCDGAGYCD